VISLATAAKLKQAGLTWMPVLHDFFAVPDRGLDDRVFVITELMAFVEIRNNLPIVTFHGTAEWALDYILTSEVVWLPREDQLRMAIARFLQVENHPAVALSSMAELNRVAIEYRGEQLAFEASEASEAYAAALLYLLENQAPA
jgi:hypothetical protein